MENVENVEKKFSVWFLRFSCELTHHVIRKYNTDREIVSIHKSNYLMDKLSEELHSTAQMTRSEINNIIPEELAQETFKKIIVGYDSIG
jgi:hypothetical protein